MKPANPNLEVEITIDPRRRTARLPKPGGRLPAPIPRIARLMALAVKFQDMIDSGEVQDFADIARLGYVTRARMTQIMNLLLLAPDLQEKILFASSGSACKERKLRRIVRELGWREQRRLYARIRAEQTDRVGSLH